MPVEAVIDDVIADNQMCNTQNQQRVLSTSIRSSKMKKVANSKAGGIATNGGPSRRSFVGQQSSAKSRRLDLTLHAPCRTRRVIEGKDERGKYSRLVETSTEKRSATWTRCGVLVEAR